ncbi:diguanylate cyclase/phosphodiesterase with PAS/PAC and GAF sensor(s), partial [mine drainage metagenome]
QDLARDPIKALSLIRTVVQIGHDLGRDVVAEGLEDEGIVEAACQLRCTFGQGYGLARPMPATALAEWVKTRAFHGRKGPALQSWVGALAYKWMMMHDALCVRLPGELASCPVTEFLEAQEIHDEHVLHWHWQVHEESDESVRVQAMRHMLQWMADKVRAM